MVIILNPRILEMVQCEMVVESVESNRHWPFLYQLYHPHPGSACMDHLLKPKLSPVAIGTARAGIDHAVVGHHIGFQTHLQKKSNLGAHWVLGGLAAWSPGKIRRNEDFSEKNTKDLMLTHSTNSRGQSGKSIWATHINLHNSAYFPFFEGSTHQLPLASSIRLIQPSARRMRLCTSYWTAMSGRAIQKLSKRLKMRNGVFLPMGHGMNPTFDQSLRFKLWLNQLAIRFILGLSWLL